MKKIILAFLVCFFISGTFIYSQTMPDLELDSKIEEILTNTEYIQEKVQNLVNVNLFSNEAIISDLASNLPVLDRTKIFESFYMDKNAYITLNLLPGFGVGSFKQKDYLSYGILFGLDLISYSVTGCGLTWLCIDFVWTILTAPSSQSYFDETLANMYKGALITTGVGTALWLVTVPLKVHFTSKYSTKHNNTLQRALLLENNTDISFAPIINPIQKEVGFVADIKL